MKYDSRIHHRRSIRLKDYDYSLPSAYFVTLVTNDRLNLFGEIKDGVMKNNVLGEIIASKWINLEHYFPIHLDDWVIIPNHLHGIIWIVDRRGEASNISQDIFWRRSTKLDLLDASPLTNGTHPGSLGAIIQNFKSVSTRAINQRRKGEASKDSPVETWSRLARHKLLDASPLRVWQRNYYEHIVRNEDEWDALRAYIADNPRRWTEDQEYRA